LQAMRPATEKRYAAPPPDFTRYNQILHATKCDTLSEHHWLHIGSW
jgi:hypothetical protein